MGEPELTPFGSSERDQLEVEFSLKSKASAIGVATYQLYPKLPKVYQAVRVKAACRPKKIGKGC